MGLERRLSRRSFIAWVSGIGAGFYFFGRAPGTAEAMVCAPIPGGTLDPLTIPRFTTPLLIPPAMPRAGQIAAQDGTYIDYYEIAVRQFEQQILPAELPATTVWGYGPEAAQGGPQIFHAPSLTIEARYGTPVRIKWINQLVDATGSFLPHLFAVDQTLHWANPPGGVSGRDTRPTFCETPGPYTGPVPLVTHVHGAVGVGDESDGYAEAWFLPAAANLPADFATVGTWYDFFAGKAQSRRFLAPGTSAWEPGTAVFQYPNTQRASTSWYHDHALGMTRLNVYAGPAGFYLVRGGDDDTVIDTRSGDVAVLPGPAPAREDPPGTVYHEIPLAIQDRSFNTDGSLFYPDTRELFDGITQYIPETDVSPQWNPELFGNCIMVNGATWPFLEVEKRRYRFRILNGCDSRFLILDFNGIPGVEVWQIGNEGGFLAAPVDLTACADNRLLLGPAERADVIVDFTHVHRGAHVLRNVGPDAPFSGGVPGTDFEVADPCTTGTVMQFNVVRASSADPSTPPSALSLPPITELAYGPVRPLALLEQLSTFFADAPVMTLLGTFDGDPNTSEQTWTAHGWEDPVTENPAIGATEVWEFYNTTGDAHPMHIHEVAFQVVNRQAILVDLDAETVVVDPGSPPEPPEPWGTGFKDTVIAYPGQVTRVRIQFGIGGQFVWHCHIVEHEDNEMMRPYRIGPVQPGQPSS
jgi:FtsP/CotA-like multicopper oxidase with cupredoxin domain